MGSMALIYAADLTPGKQEVITSWLVRQPWSGVADGETIELVGAFRFDDPAGEVGIETHIVRRADGTVLQVPLTYRGAELDGAGQHLAAEMEHSVLGHRWVYDATGDPVYAAALAAAIVHGQAGADQFLEHDGTLEPLVSTVVVQGDGQPGERDRDITTAHPATTDDGRDAVTTIATDGPALAVYRMPRTGEADGQLTGSWAGLTEPVLLATLA